MNSPGSLVFIGDSAFGPWRGCGGMGATRWVWAEGGCWPEGRSTTGILGAHGAIAQLGERLLCKQEVTGSIPVGSISTCK
jgi:hypothetical protein